MRHVDEAWEDMDPRGQDPQLGRARVECAPLPGGGWEDVVRWVPYTQAELEARAEAQRRERWLSEGQAESDEALCGLYEMLEAQRAVIEEQDDAICAVYEMMGGA